MSEVLKPSPSLLAKLGSIAVHADEAIAPGAHDFDAHAIRSLLSDPELAAWLDGMGRMALIPVKRKP